MAAMVCMIGQRLQLAYVSLKLSRLLSWRKFYVTWQANMVPCWITV
jgi:hypothetical protein